MKTPPPSNGPAGWTRRQWISSGLATCGFLAGGGLGVASAADLPPLPGYTRPGPVTAHGLAPGLQARVISENPGGEKTHAVVLAKGDELLSGLTEFARREKFTAGHFTAIGALERARFGWFDRTRKAYRDILVPEQVELLSLIGNVALVNGAPYIHAHGVVGFSDGRLRGGHLLEAVVWPTLELFFTSYPVSLIKQHDAETDLALFNLHP